jgi:hypothetical protein
MSSSKKVVYNSAGLVLRTHEVLIRCEPGMDVSSCRDVWGLLPLTPTVRKCLRCDELFDSEGSHNRICELCKVDLLTIQGTDDSVPIEFRKSLLRVTYERRRRKKLCGCS